MKKITDIYDMQKYLDYHLMPDHSTQPSLMMYCKSSTKV